MIRDATPGDIPAMLDMAERFIAVAWSRVGVPFDRDTCETLLGNLIKHETGILLFAGDAMLGALVHPWHFNARVLTATELFWWAEPRSSAAMGLWKEAERRAREMGARTFNMAAQEHMRAPALAKLYERHGYSPSERIFITELG